METNAHLERTNQAQAIDYEKLVEANQQLTRMNKAFWVMAALSLVGLMATLIVMLP